MATTAFFVLLIAAAVAVLAVLALRRATTFTTPVRVVDGDTLAVGDTRVRIVGMDAPEMDTAAGRAAKAAAVALVAGQPVRLRVTGKDTYGRLLAHATTANGQDFATALVCSGHARRRRSY